MKKEILAVIAVIAAILVAIFARKKVAAPGLPGVPGTPGTVEPPTTPQNIVCKEGSLRCSGTTLQKCVNNAWTTYKRRATECGYVASTEPTPPPSDPVVTPKEPPAGNPSDPGVYGGTCPPNVYDVKYLERVPFPGQPGMYSSVYVTKTVLAYTSDAAAAALGLRAGYNCFVSKNSAASVAYHTSGVLPAGTIIA